jgi:hypothetical protein
MLIDVIDLMCHSLSLILLISPRYLLACCCMALQSHTWIRLGQLAIILYASVFILVNLLYSRMIHPPCFIAIYHLSLSRSLLRHQIVPAFVGGDQTWSRASVAWYASLVESHSSRTFGTAMVGSFAVLVVAAWAMRGGVASMALLVLFVAAAAAFSLVLEPSLLRLHALHHANALVSGGGVAAVASSKLPDPHVRVTLELVCGAQLGLLSLCAVAAGLLIREFDESEFAAIRKMLHVQRITSTATTASVDKTN